MTDLTRHDRGMYTHPADPGEPSTGRYRVSVTEEECRILGWLARDCRVLEIGTGLGVSTRALASTALHLCTVDIDPWVHREVWPTLPDIVVALPEPPKAMRYPWRYDMALIDGDHEYEAVKKDLEDVWRLVDPGGLIVLHDCNLADVRRAAEERGKLVTLDTAGHLGLLWRE